MTEEPLWCTSACAGNDGSGSGVLEKVNTQVFQTKIMGLRLVICLPGLMLQELPSQRRREYHLQLRGALFDGWRNRVLPLWSSRGSVSTTAAQWTDWPVKPRSGPLAGRPEVKLNLPNFSKRYCNQLVDWGACGMLAVSFQQTVYIWKESGGGTGRRSYYSELLTDMGPEGSPTRGPGGPAGGAVSALSVCWSPRPDEPVLLIGTTDASIQVRGIQCVGVSDSPISIWK